MTTATVLLLMASFGLMILEVVIPSFGMLGVLSATAFVFAAVLAFRESTAAGIGVALSGLLIFPAAFAIGFRYMGRTPFGRKSMLAAPAPSEIGRMSDPALLQLVGATGHAATDLRPTGRAEIGTQRLDVIAATGFIAKGTVIVVVRVEGMRVIVEPGPASQKPGVN